MVQGDIVAEITTDKGAIEVEAPADGVLRQVIAEEGSMLPVGYIMGLIADPAENLPDVTAENERILAASAAQAADENGPRRDRRGRDRTKKRVRVRATPAARRMARDNGIDLAEVAQAVDAETVDEEMVEAFINNQ